MLRDPIRRRAAVQWLLLVVGFACGVVLGAFFLICWAMLLAAFSLGAVALARVSLSGRRWPLIVPTTVSFFAASLTSPVTAMFLLYREERRLPLDAASALAFAIGLLLFAATAFLFPIMRRSKAAETIYRVNFAAAVLMACAGAVQVVAL